LWLGETRAPADAGVTVWRAHPGSYFVSCGSSMAGPFNDDNVLRVVRIACTPTIDGCEKGPHQLGFSDFDELRPLRRGARWQAVRAAELPPSITRYDPRALEPIAGCCTTDDSTPMVSWTNPPEARAFLQEPMHLSGLLTRPWNAHPQGSLVVASDKSLHEDFAIADLPPTGDG
jgi:hypothetical protein